MRLFRADGREVACQEEQPESLLPFNNWRRRISFVDDLPGVGVSRYYLEAFEIEQEGGHVPGVHVPAPTPAPRIGAKTGLIAALAGFARYPSGPLFEPLVVEDTADSWGAGHGSYRKVVGRFKPSCRPFIIDQGPVRTITRSILAYQASRVVMDAITYPSWPVIELRFRVTWNEERRRLKLRVPTGLSAAKLLAEVPGGAIFRPADGEEHVHGRWLVIEGKEIRGAGKTPPRETFPSGGAPLAIGVASSGQHGLDFKDGELRLSVLRSSAYCHERGFDLDRPPGIKTGTRTSTCPPWKFADIGVHEFRLLVTAGVPASVKAMMPGLADHLAAPPAAHAHLPYDSSLAPSAETLISLRPSTIRLLACKRSWDGKALVIRLQETVGKRTKAGLAVSGDMGNKIGDTCPRGMSFPDPERGHVQVHVPLSFAPFEIKTVRVPRKGTLRPVRLIEENGDAK
jgi:alpha-mannosidase